MDVVGRLRAGFTQEPRVALPTNHPQNGSFVCRHLLCRSSLTISPKIAKETQRSFKHVIRQQWVAPLSLLWDELGRRRSRAYLQQDRTTPTLNCRWIPARVIPQPLSLSFHPHPLSLSLCLPYPTPAPSIHAHAVPPVLSQQQIATHFWILIYRLPVPDWAHRNGTTVADLKQNEAQVTYFER